LKENCIYQSVPLLGKITLRELNPKTIQRFVTTVGMRVDRKKTVENVYGTLSSILKKGRRWGYFIPEVKGGDVEFPVSKKPPTQTFIFDANTAALVINAATMPFRYMLLVDALCYFRIGEGDALKVSDLDFARKEVKVNAALDYATGKEGCTKTDGSCTSVPMPAMLERYLKDWLEHHYKPNPKGYLFINRKGEPYRSENVIRQGVHKAMAKLGIPRPKGVHVGVHAFRHGASSELLDVGTPINVVTRLMRHADAKTTLRNYAHLVHDSDRTASERMSQKIGRTLAQLESTAEMESTPVKTV
jgi:integrase